MTLKPTKQIQTHSGTVRLTAEVEATRATRELDESNVAALIEFFMILDRWDREARGHAETM